MIVAFLRCPSLHEYSVMIHYCEQHAAILSELFNLLFTFSLPLIQVLRLIISAVCGTLYGVRVHAEGQEMSRL